MDEIKPVAWVEYAENGNARMWSGDLSAWANRPANPDPLFSQSAVNALRTKHRIAVQDYNDARDQVEQLQAALTTIASETSEAHVLEIAEHALGESPRYTITEAGRVMLEAARG